jgi:hypothetical protein
LNASVSNQSLLGRASCVRFNPSTALFTRTIGNSWNQTQGTGSSNRSRQLAKASTHFCFLTQVSMTAPEATDSIYIRYDSNDGFYYLTGNWSGGNARLSGIATCIAYNQL